MQTIEQSDNRDMYLSDHVTAWYCKKAYQAMLVEVNLSPKPGLVDRNNCGAHRDRVLDDFYRSARAIQPWLTNFMEQGAASALLEESPVLEHLRPIAMACEEAMFQATSGVNTHKGTIFSLSLFCAAIGCLYSLDQPLSPSSLSNFCCGLTMRELLTRNNMETAGKRLYRQYGLTGGRGEAEAGYPLVINLALPHDYDRLEKGLDPESALLSTLLILIANNGDTNVASCARIAGLKWIRQKAECLVQRSDAELTSPYTVLDEFDQQWIARNLSPGGSADLLIIAWSLAEISSQRPELISPDSLGHSSCMANTT